MPLSKVREYQLTLRVTSVLAVLFNYLHHSNGKKMNVHLRTLTQVALLTLDKLC